MHGMILYDSNRGSYSPPNTINANVVLGDLDLNFQGQTIETLIFRKRRELAGKKADCDFYGR